MFPGLGEPAKVGNVVHIITFVEQVIAPSIPCIPKSLQLGEVWLCISVHGFDTIVQNVHETHNHLVGVANCVFPLRKLGQHMMRVVEFHDVCMNVRRKLIHDDF